MDRLCRFVESLMQLLNTWPPPCAAVCSQGLWQDSLAVWSSSGPCWLPQCRVWLWHITPDEIYLSVSMLLWQQFSLTSRYAEWSQLFAVSAATCASRELDLIEGKMNASQSQFIIILASFSFTLLITVLFLLFTTMAMSKNKPFLYICFNLKKWHPLLFLLILFVLQTE